MNIKSLIVATLIVLSLQTILWGGTVSEVKLVGQKREEGSPPKLTYKIHKAEGKIKIDGYLNEKDWKHALVIAFDNEIIPGDNVETAIKTECLLLFDNHSIYVGFRAYDPNPEHIRAYLSDRDAAWQDDMVAIVLDTFNDQNRAFAFFANPLGVQADEIFSDGGLKEDDSWDAIWDSGGHINEKGYEVEMAIPFRSLQFPRSKENQVWGFAPFRLYPRNKLHQFTNFINNRSDSCFLCQFNKLKGIVEASPGKNIELDPTLTAFRADERDPFPDGSLKKLDSKVEAGISGHWGVTSNLTLSATINPDFSQVEADAARLDINTQFALFYPEKRPFFLEGMDFFSTPLNAIYTRTVADPSWGIKISGKEGKNALGFFVSRDDTTNLLIPGVEQSQNIALDQDNISTVLRYRRDIGSSSTLGVLVTDREGDDYFNRLVGMDGLLRLGKSDTIRFQGLYSTSRYPDAVALEYGVKSENVDGYALDLSYRRDARNYAWRVLYCDISSDFRADLGFVPQVDYRKSGIGGGYTIWGKKDSFFTKVSFSGDLEQIYDHDGQLLQREAKISTRMEMPMQSILMLSGGARRKVYNQINFDQNFFTSRFIVRPTGKLNINVLLQYQDEIDFDHSRPGTYFLVEPAIQYNLGKHLAADIMYSYGKLNVDSGRLFSTQIFQGRLVYHFTKHIFIRAITQYYDVNRNSALYSFPVDPKSDRLFTQFLFSYKLNPRTVLFLGYSDNSTAHPAIDLTRLNRTVFLKIGYALSL
jgi:hypothetical protein